MYEATLRSGRLLCEKALLPEDSQALEEMLGELKERWGAMCCQAAERCVAKTGERGKASVGWLGGPLRQLLGFTLGSPPRPRNCSRLACPSALPLLPGTPALNLPEPARREGGK